MLAVSDAPAAAKWYQSALGARELWSLGSVVGLEIEGAPFFLHEPTDSGFSSPDAIGTTTVRVEVLLDVELPRFLGHELISDYATLDVA